MRRAIGFFVRGGNFWTETFHLFASGKEDDLTDSVSIYLAYGPYSPSFPVLCALPGSGQKPGRGSIAELYGAAADHLESYTHIWNPSRRPKDFLVRCFCNSRVELAPGGAVWLRRHDC